MKKSENIMRGLEVCGSGGFCYECPYYLVSECYKRLLTDSLELLLEMGVEKDRLDSYLNLIRNLCVSTDIIGEEDEM